MANQINVAIVGCGVIAPTHIESFLRLPEVKSITLCDKNIEVAQALAERYELSMIETDKQLVFDNQDIHAVSVCTDHASHAEIAIEALNAGKHVICEKPLGAHIEQLEAMAQASSAHSDLVFAGVFQHRFAPVYQLIKKWVDQEKAGKLISGGLRHLCLRPEEYYTGSEWRGKWQSEGGSVMMNQAIHMVDILCWMLGGAESISATYNNRTHDAWIETEDTACAALTFYNGAIGVIEATSSSHVRWEPRVHVTTEKAVFDLVNDQLVRVDFADSALQVAWDKELAELENIEPRPTASGKSYYGGRHAMQIEDFVLAILEKRPPYVSAVSAIHAVEVVKGIYQSWDEKRWVDIMSRP